MWLAKLHVRLLSSCIAFQHTAPPSHLLTSLRSIKAATARYLIHQSFQRFTASVITWTFGGIAFSAAPERLVQRHYCLGHQLKIFVLTLLLAAASNVYIGVDYHPEDVYSGFYNFVTNYNCDHDHNGIIRDILAVFDTTCAML